MKRKNSTRNALVTSVISLLLCVSMLVGTTFAWFTDSVTSSGNIIKSGNLDVEMYWADGTTDPEDTTWTDASTGAIFNYDLWEPGYTQVRHIKIANEGSLALKYQLKIVANGQVSDLADVIDVYYTDPAAQVENRTDLMEENKLGTLTEVLAGMSTSASGSLLAGVSDTVTIALKMQESAGNEYQDLAIGSDFSVQLVATQLTYETDSYDDQYDKDADYVVYYNTPGTYTLNATLMATKASDVITVQGAGVVLNITGGYYDAGSQDCAVWARNGGVVNIYGGTFIGDGVGVATSELHQDLIYASTDSKINIYGGTFSSRTDDWLLNELDNKGEIVVYGGTFVNWNPDDNVSEGPSTSFLAEGYDVIVETKGEDTYYTVVESWTSLTPENYSTTTIASNTKYALEGDFNSQNVSLVMAKGVENVVFDGSNATNINELIITQNGALIDNANDPVGERSGNVTIQNFNVLSQINVFACKTEVVVQKNTAEALMIYAGNCAVKVLNNIIDANFESHPTYRDETTNWNTNNYGIALNIFDYNLWLDGNTVTDATGHAIGINGWEGTIDNGDENVIESFTYNNITVNSTSNTKRAAFKVWDDETYASNDADTNVVNATAQAFINAVLADGSNTFNITEGYGHTIFCFYSVNTNN